mmetsp:Transcript_76863/g.144833  ORF Transcript_76863/g.144833 Transcript_76863/m.144833 type:complete len:473 (+) Transcript_76863:320-1738(+)
MAEVGDESVISLLSGGLDVRAGQKFSDTALLQCKLESLSYISPKGDARVIDVFVRFLELTQGCGSKLLRQAALLGLQRVARPGHPCIQIASAAVSHDLTLYQVVSTYDPTYRIHDDERHTNACSALAVIAKAVKASSNETWIWRYGEFCWMEECIKTLSSYAKNSRAGIRKAAVQAMGELCSIESPGGVRMPGMGHSCYDQSCQGCRQRKSRALRVLSALAPRLGDRCEDVRSVAVSVLGKLCKVVIKDDVCSAVLPYLESDDFKAFLAAAQVFISVGDAVGQELIDAAVPWLQKDEKSRRRSAVVEILFSAWEARVARALIEATLQDLVSDEDSEVQQAAQNAVSKISSGQSKKTKKTNKKQPSKLSNEDSEAQQAVQDAVPEVLLEQSRKTKSRRERARRAKTTHPKLNGLPLSDLHAHARHAGLVYEQSRLTEKSRSGRSTMAAAGVLIFFAFVFMHSAITFDFASRPQ